jgi:hypothetical protein
MVLISGVGQSKQLIHPLISAPATSGSASISAYGGADRDAGSDMIAPLGRAAE